MSLVTVIKDRVKVALKSPKSVDNEIEKGILRMVLAEVQNQEIKQNKISDDGSVVKIVRSLISSNNTNLDKYGPNSKLQKENQVLESVLPQALTEMEIVFGLKLPFGSGECEQALREAKSDDMAMGIVLKKLKTLDSVINNERIIDNAVVRNWVAEFRK